MRRIFLITTIVTAVVLLTSSQAPTKTPAQTSSETSPEKSKAYVLQPDEGEKLPDPRGGIIKVSPDAGSQRFSIVVQPLTTGKKIEVHMHERDEEVFFVHKGKGTVSLDDKLTPVEEGSVVYIPARDLAWL